MRRVCVTGSRNWPLGNRLLQDALDAELTKYGRILVIHGDCPTGADLFAKAWAIYRRQPMAQFPADWDQHGRAAGPLRNQEMLDEMRPDIVYGFVMPNSKGTRDCMARADLAHIHVVRTYYPPEENK